MEFASKNIKHIGKGLRSKLLPLIKPKSRASSFANLPSKSRHDQSPIDPKKINQAIDRTSSFLFSKLIDDHYLEANVYDNVTITAEYVMTLFYLDMLDKDLSKECMETMLKDQSPDGGWALYYGGPSDHSATVEAYFALKLCGLSDQHPKMILARKKALEGGGIENTRVFTKVHLALFGQYDWNKIPVISPELMLMPTQSPINIYEFSSWSRAVIIPLVIIFAYKPVKKIVESKSIQDVFIYEVGRNKKKDTFEHFFEMAQKLLGAYEKMPIKPFRKKALKIAEHWILEHQDEYGNWGGIYPAIANSILALTLRGYSKQNPVIQKGLACLDTFKRRENNTYRMQSTISPVWDSAISLYAMLESGLDPNHKKIQKMQTWLLSKQILNKEGDWKFKALPTRPGGWPFEHENDQYPDLDDTALVILALLPRENASKANTTSKISKSIDRGIEWMLAMQGSDGGWGAFDRDNNREILNHIPFADLKSLLDPSTPDITGHVLEALGHCGFSTSSKPIVKAIAFIKRTQEKNGSWFGRWGVNYIYGTSAVLSGLCEVKEDMNQDYILKAVRWLESIQNKDGGWGESCASYDHQCYVPLGYSTASQTAWALIALLSSSQSNKSCIEHGIDYLLKQQLQDGQWHEPEYTGTGFPRHFYLRYDFYRIYFPLLALGRYNKQLKV